MKKMIKVGEEFEDVMKKYGLEPDDVLKLTPYRRYVEVFGEPEPLLGKDEPEWEYVVSYPMSADYADIAFWDDFMAFREIIQNALDGVEEIGGSIDEVVVNAKRNYIEVENPSKIIGFKHMKLGGSEKPCWSRGRYGEGLKVAASYFLSRGGTVYVISYDRAFRFVLPYKDIAVLLGTPKEPLHGKTKVIVFGKGVGKLKEYLDVMLFKNKKVIGTAIVNGTSMGWDCNYDAREKVALSDGRGKLYVRDIFVNYMEEISSNSIFDYNLWWIHLSRDRKHIESIGELRREIGKVYEYLAENDEKTAVDISELIINKVVAPHISREGIYYEMSGDYFELSVFDERKDWMPKFIELMTDVFLKKYKLKRDLTGITRSKHIVNEALYLGYTPVLDSTPTENFILNLTTVEELIRRNNEATREDLERKSKWTIEDLKDVEFRKWVISKFGVGALRKAISCMLLGKLMLMMFFKEKVPQYLALFEGLEGVTENTIAFYDPSSNAIYYGLDRLGKTYIPAPRIAYEEAIHAITGAGDVSSEFEKLLISKLTEFYLKLDKYPRYKYYHYVALSGLFVFDYTRDKYLAGAIDKSRWYYCYYIKGGEMYYGRLSYLGAYEFSGLSEFLIECGVSPAVIISHEEKWSHIVAIHDYTDDELAMYYMNKYDVFFDYTIDKIKKCDISEDYKKWMKNGELILFNVEGDVVKRVKLGEVIKWD